MYKITNCYQDILKNRFDNETKYFYWSDFKDEDVQSVLKSVPIKDNVAIIDVPGYEKEDVEIFFEDQILEINLKDDEKTISYKIPETLIIDNVTCKAGQLIFKFKEKERTKAKLVIE